MALVEHDENNAASLPTINSDIFSCEQSTAVIRSARFAIGGVLVFALGVVLGVLGCGGVMDLRQTDTTDRCGWINYSNRYVWDWGVTRMTWAGRNP